MTIAPTNSIETIWTAMDGEKGDLVARCEQYARWTIPGVCPEPHTENTEFMKSYVVIGPRLLNSLSNKIVEAMFPHTRPFFSINIHHDVVQKMRREIEEDKLNNILSMARKEARHLEEYGMQKFNLVRYRPVAVNVAQNLIVTGNSLIRKMPSGQRVNYGIKDFGIRRDIEGNPLEVIVKDAVLPDELSDEIKAAITAKKAKILDNKGIGATSPNRNVDALILYTRWYKSKKGRWVQQQEIEGITVGRPISFQERDRPFIPLTWSLNRGDNYGRGLVEEHSNVFHNLDVTGEALFDIWQLSADVKFTVNPSSLLDVVELNASKRGSYHVGAEGDVSTIQINNFKEMQQLEQSVQRMERELAMSFLLGTGSVRDAERVTKFEVQLNALELEQAFGGLYSRLAEEWQQDEANYIMGDMKIPALQGQDMFSVTITTGMESLSREGHLQNFGDSIMDLQLLDGVPEEIRQAMNPLKVASFLFGQRGVKFEEFMYTQEEMQQMRAQAEQQETERMNQEAAAKAAGKME